MKTKKAKQNDEEEEKQKHPIMIGRKAKQGTTN